MKSFWPRLLVCLVILGALAYYTPWLAAAAVVIGVLWALAATVMQGKKVREGEVGQDLSLEAQAKLRPLLAARRDIAELVERNKGNLTVKVIGGEALQDADELIAKSMLLLRAQAEMKRTHIDDKTSAIEELQARADLENDLGAKDHLLQTIDLLKSAQDSQTARSEAASKIDDQLVAARAALLEAYSRLGAALEPGHHTEDELRETLGRLKSVGQSLDEAGALFQDANRT